MKHTLEVTPKQATDLMTQGFTVRCFLELPSPLREKKKSSPRKYIPLGAQLGRSTRGKGPGHGKAAKIWTALEKRFFADPTVTVSADVLRAWIKLQPGSYSSCLSHLVNTYKVLRIIQ